MSMQEVYPGIRQKILSLNKDLFTWNQSKTINLPSVGEKKIIKLLYIILS